MDDNKLLRARLLELAKASYQQNRYTFSNFLSPSELVVLDELAVDLKYVDYECFGGNEICERQMIRFGSEASLGYVEEYPIAILEIKPLMEKFAENLEHRDFLGAIMNLGIKREILGDIIVKGKSAYLFCEEDIADYIITSLDKIRHTNVKVQRILPSEGEIDALKKELSDMEVLVSAPRFDAIVAAVGKLSRSEAQQLFRDKKVLLNGRVCENNSMQLKEDSIFSIRGYGKYVYVGGGNLTRKGRIYVHLKKYV